MQYRHSTMQLWYDTFDEFTYHINTVFARITSGKLYHMATSLSFAFKERREEKRLRY